MTYSTSRVVLSACHVNASATCRTAECMRRRIWPAVFVVAASACLCFGSELHPRRLRLRQLSRERESQVSRTLSRASQFVDVRHISSRPPCEEVQPPEALTTPDPLFTSCGTRPESKSQLHHRDRWARAQPAHSREREASPAIAMFCKRCATWRYRPATCNGVPTETEGKIEFSSR